MVVARPSIVLKTVFAPFCMLREEILVILRLSGLLEAESRRGFSFWPISRSHARLVLGANRARKTASDSDSGLPRLRFAPFALFDGDVSGGSQYGGDVA